MLDLPKQSREGLHQLFIDIKGLAKHQPSSEIPLVIHTHNITILGTLKIIAYVFVLGVVAGVGYILITNPAGLLLRLFEIWQTLTGWI